ncbi:MAG: class I SAM-dependent methyltransferase [Desulfamplus sp.]|nr:class I SAM-dependent methyltransferase [Desulfamplus sp.]
MYDYNNLHKLWQQAHSAGSPTKFVRNQVVFKELMELSPGKTLDIGCGTGEYSIFLAQSGHDVTAFDPSLFAIEKLNAIKNQLPIQSQVNTVENFSSSELFNNIIAIEVIEHIESDRDFLKKIYSLLKKDGSLMISAPATPFLFSEADRVSGHYRRYSYNNFLNILKDSGFINIKITSYGFPILFIYSLIRKFFIDKLLIRYFSVSNNRTTNNKFLFTKCYPFIFYIDKLNKSLWSVGYVAKCCK